MTGGREAAGRHCEGGAVSSEGTSRVLGRRSACTRENASAVLEVALSTRIADAGVSA